MGYGKIGALFHHSLYKAVGTEKTDNRRARTRARAHTHTHTHTHKSQYVNTKMWKCHRIKRYTQTGKLTETYPEILLIDYRNIRISKVT